MFSASKAMVELFILADREGRGFLIVERTAGCIVLARFFQWHTSINHINDVDAIYQFINKRLRDLACHITLIEYYFKYLLGHPLTQSYGKGIGFCRISPGFCTMICGVVFLGLPGLFTNYLKDVLLFARLLCPYRHALVTEVSEFP